ncbi:hypothetical protein [Kribbella sp. NPDC004536]|uniref:hypothetical protein n=1 Tax=Kribbella sp. NPDC004536 TaxID=3364106 RepID=UPI0036C335E7
MPVSEVARRHDPTAATIALLQTLPLDPEAQPYAFPAACSATCTQTCTISCAGSCDITC